MFVKLNMILDLANISIKHELSCQELTKNDVFLQTNIEICQLG